MAARLDAGGIVDEIPADDGQDLTVRFDRCPAGWQASFELTHPDVDDLAVVHRLVAPTLPEAKAAVPNAVRYLRGTPIDEPLYD
jgi:hypothetical protein